MAKSGSLFGRADATLVQAAFAEGETKGPADYTGVYKTMAEDYGKMADDLVKEAEETYKAIYKDEIALKETFKEAEQLISNGNYSDEDMITFNNILDDYRNQAKEISKIKDPKERKEAELLFNSQFNKFQKNIPLMEQELVKVAKFVANDQHVVGGMEGTFNNTNTENSDFLIGVANLHLGKKDESLQAVRTVENGDIFYEVKTSTGKKVKLNQNDIQNLLPVEDHNAKQQYNEILNTSKTAGGTKGQKYDPNFISNRIYDLVGKSENARDTWQTISRYKSDYGDESFFEALNNPYSVLGEHIKTSLMNANLPNQFDVDNEEGITEGDFLDAENFKKIKKYIMNNPRFGAKVMGDWVAATKGDAAFKVGEGILKASKKNNNIITDNEGINLYAADMQFKGGITSNALNGYLTNLHSGKITNPIDGLIYNINDDNSWTSEDGKNQLSGNDMINQLQRNELQTRGWEFNDDGGLVTKGDDAYWFTQDKQFQAFRGSTKKKKSGDDEEFLPESIDLDEVETLIFNAATDEDTGSINEIINTINKILESTTGSIPGETITVTKGTGLSRNTITFNNKNYSLGDSTYSVFGSSYALNKPPGGIWNQNAYSRSLYERTLTELIGDVQSFVEAQ